MVCYNVIDMRKTFIAIIIAFSLLASPTLAAGPDSYISSIPRDFITGADYYFKTISGWLTDLLDLLGLYEKLRIANEGEDCSGAVSCAPGLICLNGPGGDNRVYEKLCFRGPNSAIVIDEYQYCDSSNLCAQGLWCTRTCPEAADCGNETHRCMQPVMPIGSCSVATDCRAVCGQQPQPQFGPSSYAASCVKNKCVCDPLEISPSSPRVDCPAGQSAVLACPRGTNQACTSSICRTGNCLPYASCLTSPAFGGTCLNDGECGEASCPEGASPFCEAAERVCKCRASVTETISCSTASDCSAKEACAPNEIASCVQGACACAAAGIITSCTKSSECSSDCPAGFAPACVEGSCACQRVIENVPVACVSPSDCGGVSCPSGYDKACIDSKCSCARTVPR